MAKKGELNTLVNLNNILFEQLEKITNEDLDGEKLEDEIKRNKAVIDISRVIISNASVCLKAAVARDKMADLEGVPKMIEG